MTDPIRLCYETIGVHSKSFAFASRLLPRAVRDHTVVVYAWCRRADDAIDLADRGERSVSLRGLQAELDAVYDERVVDDPVLGAFQRTVHENGIPRLYPDELLAGLAMDVSDQRYETTEQLLRYCYRVAGTVGLMMCHVMGVRDEKATRNAVHMGMAMQLTNICRDVAEDWERGRLYIPDSTLRALDAGGLATRLDEPFPESARRSVALATSRLLAEADRYYASGAVGLSALSWRCALAVGTASRVYSAIGSRVTRAGCDPLAGRAVVSTRRKVWLMTGALAASLASLPARTGARLRASSAPVIPPRRLVSFPDDVLPV